MRWRKKERGAELALELAEPEEVKADLKEISPVRVEVVKAGTSEAKRWAAAAMICEIESNGLGTATNWLREIEQQRVAEGREWARRKLEEDIQRQARQMQAICPQSGAPLKKARWRPMKLKTSVGVENVQVQWGKSKALQHEPEYSLVLMMDAWLVRERGNHWGQPGEPPEGEQRVDWREVKSAVIYRLEQRAQTASGRGMLVEKSIVACPPLTAPVDFGASVEAEARRRGLGRAKKVYIVIDGAVWLWDFAKERFKDAVLTLDFHHAAQHLWALAHELHGNGTETARAWVEPILHQLRHGEEQRVVQPLSTCYWNRSSNAAPNPRKPDTRSRVHRRPPGAHSSPSPGKGGSAHG